MSAHDLVRSGVGGGRCRQHRDDHIHHRAGAVVDPGSYMIRGRLRGVGRIDKEIRDGSAAFDHPRNPSRDPSCHIRCGVGEHGPGRGRSGGERTVGMGPAADGLGQPRCKDGCRINGDHNSPRITHAASQRRCGGGSHRVGGGLRIAGRVVIIISNIIALPVVNVGHAAGEYRRRPAVGDIASHGG